MPVNSPNLAKSPKDLGMSRADLWAFVALLALDEYLQFTKTQCVNDNYALMCGDKSTPCYSPMPNYRKMFKTGRSDCIGREGASELQQYLASNAEAHPHLGGNGEMAVKYFKDNFSMTGKAALALMGVHTVGRFNPISSHTDYAWTRQHHHNKHEIFNNEYFRNLALRPAKTQVRKKFWRNSTNESCKI